MGVEELMKALMDKLKELLKGTVSDPWTNYAIEKLIQTRATVEEVCKILMNKVDNAFPPGTRVELIQQWVNVAKPYVKPGGVALLAIILFRLLCSGGGGGSGKMMKAPGRNYKMSRAKFESNPKGYFRGLRE